MASIKPHKDGWRAQLYVAGVRDSKVLRTQREAKAWASARETELRQRKDAQPADLHTVRDMLTRYEKEVSSKKQGARHESLRIDAFLRDFPDIADRKLSNIHTPDLAMWRDARLAGFTAPDGRRSRPVSSASVQRDINWLRNAFSIARKEWHWMEHNPFEGMRTLPEAPPRTRRVSPHEVKRICRALGHRTRIAPKTKSQEVALAFLVGLRSAMRAGEILSLGKSTLDLNRRVADVTHKMQYITGRPRQVPLTRHAARLLQPVAHLDRCFSISAASLDALFRKTRNRLLIEDLHFHDSRAEALTRLARRVDVMTLAKISGHKDLRILQDVYYRESPAQIASRL
ncbi:MAG: tyrosine-type recombinase/integrase [Achromobacter sp.]|uniref:tyrosine-type recombinase/integrase n=1 Tax=Achromobacter sp. TaxID=134375 RepID=UPI001AC79ED5|nr:tyrosine-type recombinase/integrase [Achromobacter sp.]MBN9642910.1 tyrosine-type recombinase/integrase [Achromobacter sp.]